MDHAAILDILRMDAWFAGVPEALANEIVGRGRVRTIQDSNLYLTGDPPNGIYAALTAGIEVVETSIDGRHIWYVNVRPGDWVGETSALDGGLRSTDAYASGPVKVLHISMADLNALLDADPAYTRAFMRLVCHRQRMAMAHVRGLRTASVSARVAQQLLVRTRSREGPGVASRMLELSQENLSTLVGVSRQALNRCLQRMTADGLIAISYGRIEILDRPGLRALFAPAE
jgi:CRP-like cAMP-binding protein